MAENIAAPDVAARRERAQKQQQQGNFREALADWEVLLLAPDNSGDRLAQDVKQAGESLRRLQQLNRLDGLLARMLAAHDNDWRAFRAAATELNSVAHYGYVIDGKFERGDPRGGGMFVDVTERDRAQQIIWFNRARILAAEDSAAPPAELAGLHLELAATLLRGRSDTEAWRLQSLTDLEQLPEVDEDASPVIFRGRGRGRFGSSPSGAPVDEAGNPVFYPLPESFETAANDGQRWRWCLMQAAELDSTKLRDGRLQWGRFLHSQFGVQTLARYQISLARDDDRDTQSGIWSLHTLSDEETIVRLANGVKRLTLPDEYNPIKVFQDLAREPADYAGETALESLAGIYEDRRQLEKAATSWDLLAKTFPSKKYYRDRWQQVVGNWAKFESIPTQAAGTGGQLELLFRNAQRVEFTAHRLKVRELLRDVQAYLQSRPAQVDWSKLQISDIGSRVVRQNEDKYRGEQVAEWSLALEPRAGHLDRRVTVTTPLQQAGAYLVTARVADGNVTRVVLWVEDTVIVRKNAVKQSLYYVADATTGQPLANMQLDFFGWKHDHRPRQQNPQVITQRFAEKTSADGVVAARKELMQDGYQWLITATGADGRMAFLGFEHVWFADEQAERYRELKSYVMTDRPVYRPDQKVQFKIWVREATYDPQRQSRSTPKPQIVKINDPQGVEVAELKLTPDEYGGMTGEYALPKDAALGAYGIYVQNIGGGSFRVEEYKKPEFEVLIEAPEKPVALGDKITATIRAKYYFGAPVTQATVKYKVERTPANQRWYPYDRWDWLYGNGYWWFTPASDWYPGFSRWGCLPPFPSWRHWNPDPPELVLEQEVEIGADGTVQVEIDTSLAQALHADQDHEYRITAEVVDASRRTIVGSGQVTATRAPFEIFTWTNRGHYRVGDSITASFQARTADGRGVAGKGTLQLLKIAYRDGKPEESVAAEWPLSTDENGATSHTFAASAAGQYRLSYKLRSEDGAEIEGGQLLVIRGPGFDGRDFQFNDLEVIADKKTYRPGESVELLINTNRVNATVLLFVRPLNGVVTASPRVLRLSGKSTVVDLGVEAADMPNFFVEALLVSDGKVHQQVQELMVPPEERVLNIAVEPSSERYLPGEAATVELKVTDQAGEPVVGSLVLTAYDRALEYISGGSNVPEIREFFWKWRRHHQPQKEDNVSDYFGELLANKEISMATLGAFGGAAADQESLMFSDARGRAGAGGGMRMMLGQTLDMAMPMAASPASRMEKAEAFFDDAGGVAAETVTPQVRSSFADTAFWKADIVTDERGLAKVEFNLPENLSSWKLRAWGMGAGVTVGEATREVVTAKNLIVRLQAPRFFTESDEVVLSAVVQNLLPAEKLVTVELQLSGDVLELLEESKSYTPDLTRTLSKQVKIASGGEARVDWVVRAVAAGTAEVLMQALTDEESDAMKMSFPVQVHGILKTESYSRVIRGDENSQRVDFTIPEARILEQSRLEVRYSPTLAGAMVDALPYLIDYPYGCTEQTLNRFVPAVVTQHVLRSMNLDLKAIQAKRTNLNAQQIGDSAVRAAQWKQFDRNPVFDDEELNLIVKQGLRDLVSMQNSDGGWGWFSGYGEQSWPHTTAVVVEGLQLAERNDLALPSDVLSRGREWLAKYLNEQVALLEEGDRRKADPERKARYKTRADNLDAMIFNILAAAGPPSEAMQKFLVRDRLELSVYAQAQLGLALHTLNAVEQRDVVLQNLDQFLKRDLENQTAYLDLPNQSSWWFWYGNSVEANAQFLKLLVAVNPQDERAPELVKYLINNRRHGAYWASTRETAYCIEALAAYLQATGESQPAMQVEVWLDGELRQTVEITPESLFTFDNAFVVDGAALADGSHTLELRRKPLVEGGKKLNPLYFNAYVTNFTKEDPITATGLEIKVERKYYKLTPDPEATSTVAGERGQAIDQRTEKLRREPLASLSEVVSGDLIEVELVIDSKNDYEYVLFEDYKPAGCEPVDLQSGYTPGGLGAYVEYRDNRAAFFLRTLERGKHSVSYRVRAEIPGQFSALPTVGMGMYAPELRANADEMKLQIQDR